MSLRNTLRNTAPLELILSRRRFGARRLIRAYAGRKCLAEVPPDLRRTKLFRRESFPPSGPVPWLDRPDAETRIDARLAAGEITAPEAELCRSWSRNGFVTLEGFRTTSTVDRVWSAVEDAVRSGRVGVPLEEMREDGPYEGRLLDLHLEVPQLGEIASHPRTLALVELLLGTDVRPLQTLAFFAGSEQAAHSDSVHMTTYPESFLAGAWTAMETIEPDSGPLVYYPGSHRLPFYSSRDVGITVRESLFDCYGAYSRKYEPFIQSLIEREGLEPAVFTPRQGSVLLWHANLLHGGSPRQTPSRSRKSVVCHYVARDAVCYHDLSASLARAG